MRTIPNLAAVLAAIAIASPAVSSAEAPQQPEAAARSSVPEPGDPEARRQMLNAQQAQAARAQVEANSASEARHDAAAALNEMAIQRSDALYSDALTRNSEARQDYRAERKEWERTNPYCWDGDAAKCPADPVAPPAY